LWIRMVQPQKEYKKCPNCDSLEISLVTLDEEFKSQLGSPEWEEEEDMVEVELGQAHQEYVNVQIVDTKQKKLLESPVEIPNVHSVVLHYAGQIK